MTDRELLEAAAKACGFKPQGMEDGKLYLYGIQDGWNPLEDDGDALRLAVVVGMVVSVERGDFDTTRRAIVRAAAAAEIGDGR